ncbi:hypothetical protein O6H91_11G029400 [Diphasiastrum complanatum]|nr:hypothetical protein O6H91_11G029400 [Diphasiastrum complanatum]
MKEVLVKHISNSSQFELSFHDAASQNALNGLKPNTNDPAGESALSSLRCKKLSSEQQSQETMRSRGANFRAHSRFRKIGRNESCRFLHLGSSSSFSMSDDETLTTEMGVSSQISAEWAPSAQQTTSHPQRKMLCDFLSSKEAPYEQNQNLQFSSGKTRQFTKSHDPAVPATRHSSPDHDNLERVSSVRRAMLLSRDKPPGPPPLCSFCQHKSPVFGKPPKRFRFAELEVATGGFCDANFLAEGGFGSVHQGVLPNGQPVAVKQHKLASTQGDKEFCSEVEVLSCAQHRNLVMLIGYCIENNRRLLVYEFVCNGSLDLHLYGRNRPVLEWDARQKVAVGAARGLRYLHEECRVGCIVHRDMRPNNILLTHDYEAMVGDFGLARWQPNGDKGVETRVIGTFGYLAPEYTQTGQITEKADVYSFGVVLLELISGRKAIDISRPKGQQCLAEWARPLLEEQSYLQLLDPRLEHNINANELSCMLEAAALCITQDPQLRPKMSQVLHVLEGDNAIVSPKSSSSTGSSFELPFDATRNKIIARETGNCNSHIVPKDNILHRNLGTLQRASYSGPLRPDQEACKRNTLRRLSMSNAEPLSGHHPGKISSEIKGYAEA